MKKIVALLLTFCLIVSLSYSQAKAAEEVMISLAEDNLGRGAALVDLSVNANDDGSITSQTANISFYLPETIGANETVTVHMTGSSDGDFRVWFIDVNETTNSDIYQMSANNFTSGEFDRTFTLTTTAEVTEIFFKAPTFDGKINNLTLTSLSITKGAVTEETGAEEVSDTTADTQTEESPKTGESSNVLIYFVLLSVAAGALILTKKKKVAN